MTSQNESSSQQYPNPTLRGSPQKIGLSWSVLVAASPGHHAAVTASKKEFSFFNYNRV
jgi:hypothetical protein